MFCSYLAYDMVAEVGCESSQLWVNFSQVFPIINLLLPYFPSYHVLFFTLNVIVSIFYQTFTTKYKYVTISTCSNLHTSCYRCYKSN